MNSIVTSGILFVFILGGALVGMFLRAIRPKDHLSAGSKEVIKVGTGLISTMAALVLGLLVASAKSSYDTQTGEVTDLSGKVRWLDRVLGYYGPEARNARDLLRQGVDVA